MSSSAGPRLLMQAGRALLAAGLLGPAILGAGLLAAAAPMSSPTLATVATNEVYDRPASGVFPMAGHGFGHGRGLSQWGAQGAASSGIPASTIVARYYPNTAAATLANTPIRVQLAADEGRDLHVLPASGLTVTDLSTGGASAVLPTGPLRWRAYVDASGFRVQSYNGSAWADFAVGGRVTVPGPVRFSGPPLVRVVFPDYTARDYRGSVTAVRTGATTMASVVTLPMESYLYGVVPRESPASWHPEALKAQAIAARSYSAYKRNHVAASALWDICDSTSCQVFGGTNVYYPTGGSAPLEDYRTTAAVNATAGSVRTYGGTPIFAEFSASNGGWTAAGGVPYLVAFADSWDALGGNPHSSWTGTLPVAVLESRFAPAGLGRFVRMRVLSRAGYGQWGGRVGTVVLEGLNSAGQSTSVTTDGDSIRLAVSSSTNGTGLQSSWWQVTFAPPVAPTEVRASAGDASATVSWTASAGPGSSPISGYLVTAVPGGQSTRVPAGVTSGTVGGLANGTAYQFVVRAFSAAGYSPPSAAAAAVVPALSPADYHPVSPARILDTRTSGGPLAGGSVRGVAVLGRGGVPASGPYAVVLAVTVTATTTPGYLRVWPAGWPAPTTSNLNWRAGQTTTAHVVVRLGDQGALAMSSSAGSAHVVVDVAGYYSSAAGSRLVSTTPRRLLDTRDGTGGPAGALGPGSARLLAVAGGSRPVPAGATAVLLNLTAVGPSESTYLTAWPAGGPRPGTSQLSIAPGGPRAALVAVPVGAGGAVALYNAHGRVHLVADLVGWFVPPTGTAGRLAAALPARALDTRTTLGGHPRPLAAGEAYPLTVRGVGGVPASGVSAVVVNVTTTGATASGFITVWPGDASRPLASTLNSAPGGAVANVAVVPVDAMGRISLYNSAGSAHLVVDVLGWYTG